MLFSRTGAAVLASTVLAAIALSAAPAYAAPARTLPSNYTLYAIDCEDTTGQLYSLATDTAQGTPVGTASDGTACAGQGAWDPATKTAYYLGWNYSNSDSVLTSVDLVTGASTSIHLFTIGGVGADVESIAIGADGAAYAMVRVGAGSAVFSLDLGTGAMTLVAATPDSSSAYYGFSVDPTSGLFYAINYQGRVARFDPASRLVTVQTPVDLDQDPATEDTRTYSLTIDGNGIWWIESDRGGSVGSAFLVSLDRSQPGDGPILSGFLATDISDPSTAFYSNSFFIAPTGGVLPAAPVTPTTPVTQPAALPVAPVAVPVAVTPTATAAQPALAETGVDSNQITALGLSATIALLLGAGLFTVSRARRNRRA